MCKLIGKVIRKIISYVKSHIICQFLLLFSIAIVGISIIFQVYLKKQYYAYLTEKQYLMEIAVLDNAKNNLEFTLKEYINIGAEMATAEEICQCADAYKKEKSGRNQLNLQSELTSRTRNSNNLAAIAILDKDGLVFQYDTYRTSVNSLWSKENNDILMQQFSKMQEKIGSGIVPRYLVGTEPIMHPGKQEQELFHLYFPMIGSSRNINEVDMVLCLSYKMDIMNQFVNSLHSTDLNYLHGYVTDNKGIIICHMDNQYVGMDEYSYLSENHMTSLSKKMDNIGWELNIAFDGQQAMHYVDEIYGSGMLVYFGMIVFLIGLTCLLLSYIIRPIRRIHTAMERIASTQEKEKIEIQGTHEVWQLAMNYNEMVDALDVKQQEIEQQHEQMLESIERQHQAEWEALETQINGHFICNTLNTINYEAMEGGNYQVSILIKKLSNILRYSFDQKEENVYFYQEFAWIEQYLYLMKSRLEDVFDYQVEIDDNMSNWPCCKLILQPFVENAIIHGFEGVQMGGWLEVKGEKIEDYVKIVIQDNGCGMNAERADIISKIIQGQDVDNLTVGIGIRNVYSRMKLYYGDKLNIEMDTKEGKGTKFVFWLPFPNGRTYQRSMNRVN